MNSILRFIIRHRALDVFFSNFKWYRKLLIKQAHKILDKHITNK